VSLVGVCPVTGGIQSSSSSFSSSSSTFHFEDEEENEDENNEWQFGSDVNGR
jgi:hypothetical protein